MFPELVAALSEGQRAIAHLLVVLVLLVTAGLVFLVRRRARRREQTRERQPVPEEER
jgi:Flp pilus assembly protein TadB